MEAIVAPSAIVLQVLNEDNYEEWSVWVKTYLAAHGLWDVIVYTRSELPAESSEAESKALRKKNAQALHAIQISCGQYTFSLIKNVTTARDAWDILLAANQPPQRFLYDPGTSAHVFVQIS